MNEPTKAEKSELTEEQIRLRRMARDKAATRTERGILPSVLSAVLGVPVCEPINVGVTVSESTKAEKNELTDEQIRIARQRSHEENLKLNEERKSELKSLVFKFVVVAATAYVSAFASRAGGHHADKICK